MDEKLDNLTDLWRQVKRMVRLYGECLRLVAVEKIIVLLAAMTLTFLLVGLGMMIIFYMGAFCVQLLATVTGSLAVGHIIVAAAYLIIGCGIYLSRRWLIVRPITRFVYKLFNL
ncbi:MAG: hypothetical protein IKJ42_08220 [Bacteroidaceae bacterium]|nr:hypothetical protein [Bacteroidaceae bacterium]MBR3896975.1 hypothetical protein [Bacteroidaceae bacterium]